MPGRGNHIDDDRVVKSAKRKGIIRHDSNNIFKARKYEMQYKNVSYILIDKL